MNRIFNANWSSAKAVLLALACAAAFVGSPHKAMAQEAAQSGSASLNSVPDFYSRGPAAGLAITAAVVSETARNRGYGPAIVNQTSNTQIGQEDNSYTITNNGPQNASGSTNILNQNSTSTSNTVGDGDSGVIVHIVSGTTQSSSSATQGAGSQAVTGEGGVSVDGSAGNNGASASH